jgi:hypothetical protein
VGWTYRAARERMKKTVSFSRSLMRTWRRTKTGRMAKIQSDKAAMEDCAYPMTNPDDVETQCSFVSLRSKKTNILEK